MRLSYLNSPDLYIILARMSKKHVGMKWDIWFYMQFRRSYLLNHELNPDISTKGLLVFGNSFPIYTYSFMLNTT